MNRRDTEYEGYHLVAEMLETPRIVRSFPAEKAREYRPRSGYAFLTGEGSSRRFPAERLSAAHAYVASNSGRTAEAVRLLRSFATEGHRRPVRTTAIVAHPNRPVGEASDDAFILTCGPEQALFYDVAFRSGWGLGLPDLGVLADTLEDAMTARIAPEILDRASKAPTRCTEWKR